MPNQNNDGVLVIKHGSDVYQITDFNGDFGGALNARKDGNGNIITEWECEKSCPIYAPDAGVETIEDVNTVEYIFELSAPHCTTEGNWNSYAITDVETNQWPRLLFAWTWTENGLQGVVTIEQPQE